MKGGHKLSLKDGSDKGVASEVGEGRRPHGHGLPAEKKKPLTKAERRSLQVRHYRMHTLLWCNNFNHREICSLP